MKKKLLSLNDLYQFYNTTDKSMTFSSEKSGYNIAVQTHAVFELSEDKLSEGLLYGQIRAFHDLTNKNRSHIKTNVMEEKMMSIKDRPILADIIEKTTDDGTIYKDFNGHTKEYDEKNDKIIYIEHPVGHFVNPESIHIEYDENYDKNFVCSDVVIYEEYTDTCDILRRRKVVDCSIELCIRDMVWDNKNKVLFLNDFYAQGCTLLGEHVTPGMDGSKLTLKDFSEENNSLFSHEESEKLIESLEKLNYTLSNIHINFAQGKEDKNKDMSKIEELLLKYDKTLEDINFDYNDLSDENLEIKFKAMFSNKEKEKQTNKMTRIYEISHEDIRHALYQLLTSFEETNNDYCYITNIYDAYFIFQNMDSKYYGCKYIKSENEVSLDGKPYVVYAEFLTETEKNKLNEIRSNYETISEKLSKYEEAEEISDKMSVFNDEAYSSYLATNEFKELMKKSNILKYSKEELVEKADAALGKLVKKNKTYSVNTENDGIKNNVFAFAAHKKDNSFLDTLLKKENK